MVAAAIVGGAVIGGISSNMAASRGASATRAGAEAGAGAQLEATRLQVDEIARQFDYQQQILTPQIQQQYAAQGAYSDLLGIGGGAGAGAQPPGGSTGPAWRGDDQNFMHGGTTVGGGPRHAQMADYRPGAGSGPTSVERAELEQQMRAIQADIGPGGPDAGQIQQLQQLGQQLSQGAPQASSDQHPAFPGRGSTQFQRGDQGQFVDPNLDPTRLSEAQQLTGQVEDTRLAPTDPDADPYRNYIMDNQIAAPTLEEDARFARARDVTLASGAAGTGVYGEEFEASPGYGFQVEEMDRALDRRNSAGGNFGGRAIMEAQRRAQGLAQGDYYNWAAGRERDLSRLGQAEATDIGRGDMAVDAYERQRVVDVGRGDAAYENYLGRQVHDTSRMDAAVGEQDRLRAVDLQRSDQGYYNYLQNLARQAGMGDAGSQAVQASQTAAGQTAGAYGQQGGQLSQIYNNLGINQAQIQQQRFANMNNAAQSGVQNWMTYQMSQNAA